MMQKHSKLGLLSEIRLSSNYKALFFAILGFARTVDFRIDPEYHKRLIFQSAAMCAMQWHARGCIMWSAAN